jgi:hypothetical protein
VADGVVYAVSNGITALAPKAGQETPEQLWRLRQINPSTISPLVLGGLLYSVNGAGVIATADVKSGAAKWKLRLTGPFSASPVGAGTNLVAVNEKGLVQIVDPAIAAQRGDEGIGALHAGAERREYFSADGWHAVAARRIAGHPSAQWSLLRRLRRGWTE